MPIPPVQAVPQAQAAAPVAPTEGFLEKMVK